MCAPWSGRPVEIQVEDSDQIKTLTENSQYHTGNSPHTKNIQINEVIGENEKCVFILRKKTYRLFDQPNTGYRDYIQAFI